MTTHKIAIGQMTSTADIETNFSVCKALIEQAKKEEVSLLSLPENFAFMPRKDGESYAVAETLDGPLLRRYCELAKKNRLWLSLGGFPEKSPYPNKIYNTHVIINSDGEIQASYRKINLFNLHTKEGLEYGEATHVAPGDTLITSPSPVGTLGLAICFDVRFPQMHAGLRKQGAQILLFPSAFTKYTGQAHWEILLRARAIETQCYVAAAAQTGTHNGQRQTFGHAMIVDPWGTIVAQCDNSVGIATAEINLEYLQKIRQQMPMV